MPAGRCWRTGFAEGLPPRARCAIRQRLLNDLESVGELGLIPFHSVSAAMFELV